MNRIVQCLIVAQVAFVSVGCSRGPTPAEQKRFEQAEASFAEAATPEEFLRVAGTYQQLLDDGLGSATVLFNQGNAFVRAEQPGRAIACYRQALRLRPRSAAIRANLETVLAKTGGAESPPGWFSRLIFWHDDIGYGDKFVLVSVMLSLTAMLVLAGRVWPGRLIFRTALVLSMLSLLAVTSVLYDWNRYERHEQGVVTSPEVTPRKGNGESYQPAFNRPLTEGTEFEVVEHRGHWLRVRVAAGECWLPDSDVVVY